MPLALASPSGRKPPWLSLPLAGLALLTLPACGKSDRTSADERQISRLERDWATAYVHADVATLNGILADDFIGRWADGSTSTKPEELASVRSGHEQQQANDILEMKTRVYRDVAIVTWKTREKRTVAGKDASGLFWGTDVFLKRGGRWQAVAAQTSKLKGPGST